MGPWDYGLAGQERETELLFVVKTETNSEVTHGNNAVSEKWVRYGKAAAAVASTLTLRCATTLKTSCISDGVLQATPNSRLPE
jgi:hypothetical protein